MAMCVVTVAFASEFKIHFHNPTSCSLLASGIENMSMQDKFAKDELNPSLNVICTRPHEGATLARETPISIDVTISPEGAERLRLDRTRAQKKAFYLHKRVYGISGSCISNIPTFFAEKFVAGKISNPLRSTALAADGSRRDFLSVGTDCSGMEAPILALDGLNIHYKHRFSCDNDADVVKTIQANHKPDILFHDVKTRDNTTTPYVDLYVAGFPCQPFSVAGKQQGFDDDKGRGTIFFKIANYIDVQRPMVFILENVKGLVTMDNGKYLKKILRILRNIGEGEAGVRGVQATGYAYEIHWKILNTYDHGIPHSRARWYCVGLRRDAVEASSGGGVALFLFQKRSDAPTLKIFWSPLHVQPRNIIQPPTLLPCNKIYRGPET